MVTLFNRIRSNKLAQLFTVYLRFLLGVAFIYAFTWKTGPWMNYDPLTFSETQMNPAFAFQAIMRIKALWIAVCWLQLLSGFLLCTQRYATIGALIYLPLIFCIFLITAYVGFRNTWIITGLMLLGIIYLIIWDWNKFILLAKPESGIRVDYSSHPEPVLAEDNWWQYTGLVLGIVSLATLYYKVFLQWAFACLLIGALSFLLYSRKKKLISKF